jgi:fatty aldehyde-generating acyl-ACP reductase
MEPRNNFLLIPSNTQNFEKVIKLSTKLLGEIGSTAFVSPYSLIPIISQALGLNTPLMGSGDSPYSLISMIRKLRAKEKLFDELFKLPIEEKRRIADEMYEFIAPVLLNEADNYIDLVLKTKYRMIVGNSLLMKIKLKSSLKNKMSLVNPLINKVNNGKGDFGYIVHYGHPSDLFREHNFIERLPKTICREWAQNSFPVVNEIYLRNFPIYKSSTKSEIAGWVIFITNHTKELLEDGKLRTRKILQAAMLCEKLGAKMVGMGGLVASFAQGGGWLSKRIPEVGFTTGHAYTISNIANIIDTVSKRVDNNVKQSAIAIVGAAGSIGSGCAKLISEKTPKEIILVDINGFDIKRKLEKLKNEILLKYSDIKISYSFNIKDIKKADLIVIATNSTTSLIEPRYLKPGAILIDDSFPKNVPKSILKKRNDIILVEGGVMQLPKEIDFLCARNMPDLMDAPLTRAVSCKETYGCVAEIIVLALFGYTTNYGLGSSDPRLARDIINKAKKAGFRLAPLQCYDESIDESRLEKVREILRKNRVNSSKKG